MIRDHIVITLGNFMHSDLSLKKCFLALLDCIGMGILLTFLGYSLLG